MITAALRRVIRAAAGAPDADPGLRPTGIAGQYAASVALARGARSVAAAGTLAEALAGEPWIQSAEVTGPGYLTITVTPEALAGVADAIVSAGPACVMSDALAGHTVSAAPQRDPLTASTWEEARAALAVRLTVRLAAAAGATVAEVPDTERILVSPHASSDAGTGEGRTRSVARKAEPDAHLQPRADVAAAIAFAGRDAVTFTLARAIPGKPLRVEPEIIARHVPRNPAYAVRYAHARAASGVRWAVASPAADTIGAGGTRHSLLADPRPEPVLPAAWADAMVLHAIGPGRRDIGEYEGTPLRGAAALLDALSWLPERVATAARRGRPDEFARYLEDLASVTVDVLSSASHLGRPATGRDKEAAPGSDRLTLAMAARTGLAAGLGLLEVSAPERLLAETYKGSQA